LIEILDCPEDEYLTFIRHAQERARIRPAEYDRIPDIVNTGFELFLINLVVGIALSAISYALTPKPKAPEQKGGQKTLASRTGAERFASTYGFESAQELARYGETLPIVWTLWTGNSGGVLVSPRLVWSRIRGLGGQEVAKLHLAIGEGDVEPPDLKGIFIGNNSIDALPKSEFAYWHNQSGRCVRSDLKYGSQAKRHHGDPDLDSYLFSAGMTDGAFSGTFIPSNNTSFGVYESIPNGLTYRVNWRVLSYPEDADLAARNPIKWERRKIAGPNKGHPGMYGVGCGWPRRMGLVKTGSFAESETNTAKVGDKVVFRITGQKLSVGTLGDSINGQFNISDIDNTLDSECARADSILQIGETIQIGMTLWKVTDRELDVWDVGKSQWISLECTELVGGATFGIPPAQNITSVNPIEEDRELLQGGFKVGVPFYPLARTALAHVKNTRPCDRTEICIKSQVWTRLNGICNFQTIPKPSELQELDAENISVTSGTTTLYDWRTSVFNISYREIGEEEWIRTEVHFCVRGSAPVDQYNFLVLRHPKRGAYEFRFIPVPSAKAQRFPDSTKYIWLQGGSKSVVGVKAAGDLQIEAPGVEIGCRLVEELDTMRKDATKANTGTGDGDKVPVKVTGVGIKEWINFQAYMYMLLGRPSAVGQTKTASVTLALTNLDPIVNTTFTVTATSYKFTDGTIRWPQNPTIRVTSSGCNKRHFVGGEAIHTLTADGNNPNGVTGLCRVTYVTTAISATGCATTPDTGDQPGREFEGNTQIGEVSFYGDLLSRSCDSGPEHAIVAVNELLAVPETGPPSFEDMSTAALSIKSSRNMGSVDQIRLWIHTGTNSSNSFPQLVKYVLEGNDDTIDTELIDYDSITKTDAFCKANGLLFDGAIDEKRNLRSYLTEIAPYFLCNFVIRNGRFGIEPALPLNTDKFEVTQLFTADNIIEGSLNVEYLALSERRDFQANVIWRTAKKNELFRTVSARCRWDDKPRSLPIETLDLSTFCTTREHAVLAAKYLMSVRRRLTHALKFQTAPEEASVAPGALIKVALNQTVQNYATNGVVAATGVVTSATRYEDGDYSVLYYKPGMPDVDRAVLHVQGGATSQPELFGSMFTVVSENILTAEYMVDSVEIGDDGLVSITAVNYPVELMLSDIQGDAIVVEDT
jgi:hypothetical protein